MPICLASSAVTVAGAACSFVANKPSAKLSEVMMILVFNFGFLWLWVIPEHFSMFVFQDDFEVSNHAVLILKEPQSAAFTVVGRR